MKNRKLLISSIALLVAQSALAQKAIKPGDVVWSSYEHFESVSGFYTYFPGFSGTAMVQRYGGGMIQVTTSDCYSGVKSIYGDQTDVAVVWPSVKQAFGGYFKSCDIWTTGMWVTFYRAGLQVGITQFVSVSTLGWSWKGWNLNTLGGFDAVKIVGNGGFAGFIKMDGFRVR